MAHWLVTGGCGFIGSHLVDALVERGDSVHVLDDLSTGRRDFLPARADLTVGDIADRDLVDQAMADVDGCFHLAAVASVQRGHEDWVGTHRTNLTGTVTVLDAARRRTEAGRRTPVVYASSAAVYGSNDDVPLQETAKTMPLSAYGADKLAGEMHAAVAATVFQMPTVGFRFFNVYGPRQDPNSPYSGVIARFVERLRQGRAVTFYGDGSQVRDFIFVGDVVGYLLAAMDGTRSGAQVFNLCTGQPTSVRQLAELIAELCQAPLEVQTEAPRSGDIVRSIGDPAQLGGEFGSIPSTRLADGLRWTIDALEIMKLPRDFVPAPDRRDQSPASKHGIGGRKLG